ncbi:MAG: hypothetical protein LRS47_03265 [Desulfurococcales archaeon]|nr:hypothetical protein [Desulfurococcales archaeon]
MRVALAYYYSPDKASYMNSHGRRRSWLAKTVKQGLLLRRLLNIFNELTRTYKRSTYLLEEDELAEEALEPAREAFRINNKINNKECLKDMRNEHYKKYTIRAARRNCSRADRKVR